MDEGLTTMNPYVLSTIIPVTAMEVCRQLGIEAELYDDGEILVHLPNVIAVRALCNLIDENFTAASRN